LSGAVVFDKRDNLCAAFHGFNPAAVAAMNDADIERLMADTSIIRNRRKLEATVHDARLLSKHSLA
jgi:DNA-3-methyladenine glycosylase I